MEAITALKGLHSSHLGIIRVLKINPSVAADDFCREQKTGPGLSSDHQTPITGRACTVSLYLRNDCNERTRSAFAPHLILLAMSLYSFEMQMIRLQKDYSSCP